MIEGISVQLLRKVDLRLFFKKEAKNRRKLDLGSKGLGSSTQSLCFASSSVS